jgi:4-amino-4-deoxy-L-arabinose transferase-like glycosyltransferase
MGSLLAFAACLICFALGVLLVLTTLPLCDEGYYGVTAHQLATAGLLRNPVLEQSGFPYFRGIDHYFYVMAPVGMAVQAAAFRVAGFHLVVQRGASLLCAVATVLLAFLLLRRLLPAHVAGLAALFLSIDFVFLGTARYGRSDAISLFFGVAAVSSYLCWRERNYLVATAMAHSLCALCGLSHPNGGLAALAALTVLTLVRDRQRLRWPILLTIAACYAGFGACFAVYIAKAPDLFAAQSLGNAAQRMGGAGSLLHLATGEAARIWEAWIGGSRGVAVLRLLLPASYAASMLLCLFHPALRRRCGILWGVLIAVEMSLMLMEGSKQGWYLVHLSPYYCAFLAVGVDHLWTRRAAVWRGLALMQTMVMLLGAASLCYSAAQLHWQRLYEPAVAFLNAHIGQSDLLIAQSEFYFELENKKALVDDPNLGAYSGRRADYIVIDKVYAGHLTELKTAKPAVYGSIERRLGEEYREVFRNSGYRILQRKSAGG